MAALGSLVVSMALEWANYTAGLTKTEQETLKMAKRVQDTMDGLKSTLAVTAGAVAGGIAAAFSISAFKNLITGTIESNAALHDLSIQTGASAVALSGLAEVGRFSGQTAESIADAMGKLTKNMAAGGEESKGAGLAIKALGLDFDAFKRLTPDEQMRTVAKAMDGFADGSGKAAVAMALYGKEGAKMLPYMKDLAEVGELQATATQAQIDASDNFDDNLLKLQISGDAWKKELAQGIIPALDKSLQAVLDMGNGTGGLRDEIKRLVADGTITQWSTNAVVALSYLVDMGQTVMVVLRGLGKVAGAQMAVTSQVFGTVYDAFMRLKSGDFGGAFEALKSGVAGVSSVVDSAKDDIAGLLDEKLLGQRFREQMDANAAKTKAVGDAADATKPSLDDFANRLDKSGKASEAAAKAAEAHAQAFAKLIASIEGKTAAYTAEAEAGAKLTEGQKTALGVMEQLRQGTLKLTQAEAIRLRQAVESMLVAEEADKLRQEELKQLEAARAARMKDIADMERVASGMSDQNQQLRDEIELIGLNEQQQLRVVQARNEALIATKEATLAEMERAGSAVDNMSREAIALQAQIAQLRERNQLLGAKYDKTVVADAARQASDQWKQFNSDIERGLTDSLYRSFEAGKGFFTTLWDGIRNLFKTTVLKLAVQAVVGGVSGGSGGVGGLTSGGGLGNLISSGLGQLGNLIPGFSAFGGAMGSGFMAAINGGMGVALEGGMAMLGSASGLSSALAGIGQIAGALGPIALGIGAVVALVKKFDTSGTPHGGSMAEYSAADGLSTSQKHGAYGMGFGGVDANAAVKDLVSGLSTGLVGILDSVSKAFGGTGGYKVATGFADDSSKDGAWGGLLISKLGEVLVNWDDTRSSKWAPKVFADGEAGQKQYLAALAKDVSGMVRDMVPSWGKELLDALGDSPAIEDLATVIDQINATKAALDVMGKNLVGFSGYSDDAASALIKASGGIAALASNAATYYENYYSESERQANATRDVTDALGKINVALPSSRDEYRKLVEQYTAMGAEGADVLAVLLGLSGAFAAITPAGEAAAETVEQLMAKLRNPTRGAEDIARNTIGLEDKLYLAENKGNTGVLRERELQGLTDVEKAIQRRIWALDDERDAAEKAAQVLSERQGIERDILGLQGDTAALRALELAGLDPANRALKERYYGLMDEAAAAEKAAQVQSERQGIERDILGLQGDTAALRALELAGLDPANRALKEHYYALLDEKAAAEAAASAVRAAAAEHASLQERLWQIEGNTGALREAALGKLLDEESRDLQRRIWAAEDEAAARQAAAAAASAAASAADQWAQQQAAAAKAVRDAWQGISDSLVDEIKRIRGEVLGDSSQGYAAAQGALAIAMAQASSGNQDAFKALPGLSQAMLALARTNVSSQDEYDAIAIATAARLQELNDGIVRRQGLPVPAYAEGGAHTGGWALVGEQGPELAYLPPARIYTAQQTTSMFSSAGGGAGGGVQSLVDELRQQNAQSRAELAAVRKLLAKVSSRLEAWDGDGLPEERVLA